ncbi:MAG: glyoxylate/hydroxypyruvate reductase A, partial [Pseudomonadota bacterium]
MTILLALTGWDTRPWIERLSRHVPGYDIVTLDEPHDIQGIKYICAWKPPQGVLSQYANLKILFSLGAGVDHLLSDPDLPNAPLVRVVSGNLTMRMTEYVVQHVLMHHRQHRMLNDMQTRKAWREVEQPSADQVRVGIMGLGELGTDAAITLKKIGFRVSGWSRGAKEIEGVETYCGHDTLPAFLSGVDILVCLLPHTPETDGILGIKLFRLLAQDGPLPDAFPAVINAGRGKLQVEPDIIEALNKGVLKGATLDVFETEPLPETSPLWNHPRVT